MLFICFTNLEEDSPGFNTQQYYYRNCFSHDHLFCIDLVALVKVQNLVLPSANAHFTGNAGSLYPRGGLLWLSLY